VDRAAQERMSSVRDRFNDGGLTVGYRKLGTISIDELAHAIHEDIQALKDIYHVRFVSSSRLRIVVTDEYGEPLHVRHPLGGPLKYIDTHHFRPACLDYKL
jgi:hypothetical protein